MNDAFGIRALLTVGIDMGHDVMADFLLTGFGHIIIDVIFGSLQFFDLLVCDGKAQLLFCLSQGDPQAAPGTELIVLGKNKLHLFACIAF